MLRSGGDACPVSLAQVSEDAQHIAQGLDQVRTDIADSARAAGRDAADVQLVAASKTVETPGLRAAIEAGQRVFGENRVQEAQGKWPALRAEYPDLELHLIGPLQSNKVGHALELFDVIESLDRPKLAAALVRQREAGAQLPRLLVQVNIGREPQKAGVDPDALPDFLARCEQEWQLPIEGLMAIPPAHQDPAPYFRELDKLRQDAGLEQCSMGMSGDFTTAVACGATMVRVGSKIFGARTYR